MAKVCLVVTKEIRELAKNFPNETPLSIANLISLYIEDHNIEDENFIPEVRDLKQYIKELRNIEVGTVDLANIPAELRTAENMTYARNLGKKLGLNVELKDNRYLACTSDFATKEDFQLFNDLVFDIVFSGHDGVQYSRSAQKRLDTYLNWENTKRKAGKLTDIKIMAKFIQGAKTVIRDEVDTRPAIARQYKAMTERLTPLEAKSIAEGIASMFSDIWTDCYERDSIRIETELEALRDLDNPSSEQLEQIQELKSAQGISRYEYLKNVGPNYIFDQVKDRLKNYATASRAELKSMLQRDTTLPASLMTAVFLDNYQSYCEDALECFDLLCEDAAPTIENKELIVLKNTYGETALSDRQEPMDSENPEADFTDDDKQLESYKEIWMYDYDSVSTYSKLPVQLRSLLGNCPFMNRRGRTQTTILGTVRTLPINMAIPVLLRGMHGVQNSMDVIPALRSLVGQNPWVSTVVTKLTEDPQLLTMFFINMKKAQKICAVAQENEDGSITMDIVNRANKTSHASDEAVARLVSHNPITDRSAYNSDGKIDRDNVLSRLKELEGIKNSVPKAHTIKIEAGVFESPEMKQLLVSNPTIARQITSLLQAVGFVVDEQEVLDTLYSPVPESAPTATNNLTYLLNCLSSLYMKIRDNNKINTADDIARECVYNLNDISAALVRPDTTEVEDSFNENGKLRFTHVLPSDLDTIIEGFKGEHFKEIQGKAQKRINKSQLEYIREKYLQDSYYYSQETGYNSLWLEDLAGEGNHGIESIDYIEVLDHKDLKGNVTKPDRWNALTRAKMHWNFYHRKNPYSGAAETWYPIPVPSDVQTARYVKFRTYTHDELIDGYKRLIQQEITRMLETDALDNMPEVYVNNKNRFCMLPELNNYNGRTAQETVKYLSDLSSNDTSTYDSELEAMAIYALNKEKEKYVKENWRFIDKVLFPGKFEQEELINLITSENNEFIGNTLEKKGLSGKFGLRDYIENSSYAQSQMVELFVGDPAFFKDYTDLQKRFKQVIVPKTPIDPFNKYANPNQQEELQERCVYLQDISAASNSIEEIKKLYAKKLADGKVTQAEYDSVVRSFSDIMYTDGQAYRTPKGFRKILFMQGMMKEGDALDRALTNIFNNTASSEDFEEIRRAQESFVRKPFTSGMLPVNVGNGMTKLMPIQHKTSEQLLTAALTCAAMTTGQSPELRAMAKFADENDIDIFIFNSGVKEGNNGYAVINETNVDESPYIEYSDEDLYKALENGEIQIERLLGATQQGKYGILEKAEAILEGRDVVSNETELVRGFGNKVSESKQRRRNGVEQEDALEAWAKEDELWLNDLDPDNNLRNYLNSTYEELRDISGSESVIFRKDSKTLVKEISLSHSDDNPRMLLDRLVWHNRLFPETSYTVLGFGRDADGHFKVIAEQPYVRGTNATPEEIKEWIQHDFNQIPGTSLWISKNGDLQLTDLSPLNVLKGEDGRLYVIDCDIELANKNAGILRNNNSVATQKNTEAALTDSKNAIHSIPYSMWGTVSTVPEHGVDKTINIGTQLQKILAEDIPDDAKFIFEGKEMTKSEIISAYNALYTEKIMRAYKDISGTFADKYKLSKKLQQAVKNSSRGSDVLRRAFELDENDNFIIPLCDLSTITLSSEFLNSIIRKAITKVEMPGGQFVQMSAFGLSDKLSIEWQRDNDGNPIAPKAIQCYMSAYSRSLIEAFMDEKGYINPDDLPDELRLGIGCRIPTEGKYFIAPLRIVGFLPEVMPTTIVLPADIVALTDSDFDVDKVPVLLSSISKYNIKKAYDDYFNVPGIRNAKRQAKSEDIEFNFMLKALRLPTFSEWFKDKRKDYLAGQGTVEYASGKYKNLSKLSEAELNNKLLECMYSMLTSPDISEQVINSGDTGPAVRAANRIKDILGLSSEVLSPASISTAIAQQDRNNAGKNMISIFAVANALHAIIEHLNNSEKGTDFSLKQQYAFTINGHSNLSLTGMKARDGMLISKYIGAALGSAADNAKEPLLYYLNINQNTANAAALLLHLGYTIEDVGMFLNIPAVREYSITNTDPAYVGGFSQDSRTLPGNISDMAAVIKEGITNSTSKETLQYNATALGLFKFLQKEAGKDLFELGQLARGDSGSSAPHGALENNIARVLKYRKYQTRKSTPYYFDGWENMFSTSTDFNTAVKDSDIPIAQAFISYGSFGSYELLSRLYPGLNADDFETIMLDCLDKYYGGYITPKNVKELLYSLYSFMQSSAASFRKEGMNVEDSRYWYLSDKENEDNFLNNAKKLLNSYPSLNEYSIVRHLIFGNSDEDSPFIDLKFDGHLTKDVRDLFSREWAQMFYSSDPKVREFAQDLYVYSFYRNGLQFTNGSFAHLAPIEARTELPGYVDELRLIQDRSVVNSNISGINFEYQFLRNHLNDDNVCWTIRRGLTPYLDKDGNAVQSFYTTESSKSADYMYDLATKKGCFKAFHNGQPIFYIAVDNQDGTIQWVKTTPLGWGYKSSEYNNEIDAFDLVSVYDQNRVRNNLYGKRKNAPAVRLRNDSISELESAMNDIGMDELDYQIRSYSYNNASKANAIPAQSSQESSGNTLSPNREWKDANDNPMCFGL